MSKTPAIREMERREAIERREAVERREAAAAAAAAAAMAEEERAMTVAAAAEESAAPAPALGPAPAPAAALAAGGLWGTRERGLSSEMAARANGTAINNGVAVKRRGSTGGAIESSSARGGRRVHQLRSAVSSVNTDTARAYAGAPLASPPGGKKGKVAAIAASWGRFGDWGRGGDLANAVPVGGVGTGGGAGALQMAGGGSGSGGSGGSTAGRGGAAGAPASAPAEGGGDGHAKYGGDGVERRKGLMDGLDFGNVRQKANAWGVPLRS